MLEGFERDGIEAGTEAFFLWIPCRVEQMKAQIANNAPLFQAFYIDAGNIEDIHNGPIEIWHWPFHRTNTDKRHVDAGGASQHLPGGVIVFQIIVCQTKTGTLQR